MPSELGSALWNLVRERYNFDAAGFSREMIDQNLAGWSNIFCFDQIAKTWDGKTKLTVEQVYIGDDMQRSRQRANPPFSRFTSAITCGDRRSISVG